MSPAEQAFWIATFLVALASAISALTCHLKGWDGGVTISCAVLATALIPRGFARLAEGHLFMAGLDALAVGVFARAAVRPAVRP